MNICGLTECGITRPLARLPTEMLLRSRPLRYGCTPTEYYVMTRCAPVECYALTRSWPVHVRFHCGRKAWLALWCSFCALLRRLGRLRHVAPYCAVWRRESQNFFDKFGKEIRVQKSFGENVAEQWSLERNIQTPRRITFKVRNKR